MFDWNWFERERKRIRDEFLRMVEEIEGRITPLHEIRRVGDEVIVTIDLPGVSKEDIKLYATEDSLQVIAKCKKEIRFREPCITGREATLNEYRATISLPVKVEPEEAKARFKFGVLEVRLPVKTGGKRIKVE